MQCKTILIVEDDEGIQEILKLALELEGYSVCTARNGKEGFEVLATLKEKPCLILLDLMMPIMDGWTFANTLLGQEHLNRIPFIVISAFHDAKKPVEGAEFILTKPINLDSLLEVVAKFCTPG